MASKKTPHSKESPTPRREELLRQWGPLLIALLAFLIRMVYLAGARRSSLFESLGLDARFYDRWAREIVAGDWIGSEPFFMGPLYPYVLAVVYRFVGSNVFAVAVLQAAIDSATCALVYLVARRIWKEEWAGPVAGGLACLYGPMMLYTGELLLPTLGMLLNLLFLYLLLRFEDERKIPLLVLAGAVLGISALGRATVLVFYPVVVAWWWLQRPRLALWRLLAPPLLLLVGAAAVVLPVTVRNRVVGEDWVLITSNAGLNFYIGNGPTASGAYLKPRGLDVMDDPEGRGIAEAARGRPLKPSEVSDYWFSETRGFLGAHPGRFAEMFVKKQVLFWGALEIPQIEDYNFQRRYSPLLRLPFPSFAWIAPLALIGVVLAGERRRRAVLPLALAIAYSAAIAVFFVTARYRMAIVPYLLVLSAGGILILVERFRAGRTGILGLIGLVALVGLAHLNPYQVDPESGFGEFEYRLGINAEKVGDLEQAAGHYREALRREPRHPGARLNLGVILSRTGRLSDGRLLLEGLSREQPANAKAHFNLGVVESDLEEYALARESYGQAVALDPKYVQAWLGIGVEDYRAGNLEGAESALRRVLSLAKEDDAAWIGQSRFLLGKLESKRESRSAGTAGAEMLRQGDIRMMVRDLEGAHDSYAQAARETRHPDAYYEAGVVALELGRLDGAIEALAGCLERDPDYPGAHFSLAAVFVKRQDYPSALREFEAETRVSPDIPEVYLNLGLLYENFAHDAEAALGAYEEYVRLGGAQADMIRERIRTLQSRRQ